jgi:hypothetical protein
MGKNFCGFTGHFGGLSVEQDVLCYSTSRLRP